MTIFTYTARRSQLQTYFDRTAVDAWARLTGDGPVSRIRETVRAGRDEMRSTLLDWLPARLDGCRILDAGAGTGVLSAELARRGADVVAIDLSPRLIAIAQERVPSDLGTGQIEFRSGDMLDPELGTFDYTVCMDSLIHYEAGDIAGALARLASRTRRSVNFTIAPRTAALTLMHAAGRAFPRSDRAPSIEPVSLAALRRHLSQDARLSNCEIGRTTKISRGFYISQAVELVVS